MNSKNLRKRRSSEEDNSDIDINNNNPSELNFKEREIEKSSDKIELLYDGNYYDVTEWIKRHPGGDIINLYTSSGEDATMAVHQFHIRQLPKVKAILRSLPHRPASDDENPLDAETLQRHKTLSEDFEKLTEEVIAEGLLDPNPRRFALRIAQSAVLFAIGLAISLFLGPSSVFYRIISVLIIVLGAGQALWLGHEGGHNGFTGDKKYDRIVQIVVYGFVFGLSASSWNSTHAEHHAMPQHVTKDSDLKTLPILAFNKELIVKRPSLAKSFFLRNQKWLFALCDTCIVTLTWKFNHHIKFCIQNEKWFDLACMICHYSLVPLVGIVDWMAITWLGSIYVLGNLILSHTHLPIVEEGKNLHWVEYAFHHTTNIRSSWWVDWWTGHLNYQIEHHLWPAMPEYKNKLCREKSKAFAAKHGLPYYLCNYWDAVKTTYHNLENVSEEIRHIM